MIIFMKKGLLFCLIFFSFIFLALPLAVWAADPHLELSPSSGAIGSTGTSIDVLIDSGGQAIKSAKAVINYSASQLEVSSIQAGDFFDDVSHNIYNSTGQVIINANLSLSSMLESKTGSGTLATMTMTSKLSSGTGAVTFDCTEGSSTDSNINDPTPLDIIVCSANVNGSYTLAASASADGTGTSTTGGTGGATATTTAVPVTGVNGPTIGLLLAGFVLLFTPLFSKIRVNG